MKKIKKEEEKKKKSKKQIKQEEKRKEKQEEKKERDGNFSFWIGLSCTEDNNMKLSRHFTYSKISFGVNSFGWSYN